MIFEVSFVVLLMVKVGWLCVIVLIWNCCIVVLFDVLMV